MCCKSFWKRIVSFSLALVFGLLAVSVLHKENSANKNQEKLKPINTVFYSENGTGISGKSDTETGLPPFLSQKSAEKSHSEIKSFQIISKPQANYTDAARQNQTQGNVRLRVTFLASGQIGNVSPIIDLSDGLTEQAIKAARQIKFEPEIRNGKPISIIKIIEYSFTIY